MAPTTRSARGPPATITSHLIVVRPPTRASMGAAPNQHLTGEGRWYDSPTCA